MIKKVVQSPAFLAVLFLVALALVLVGGIGAAQSAPRIQSADWRGEVELTDIHTALVENGEVVEGQSALLGQTFIDANEDTLKGDVKNFQYGVSYNEVLSARNVNDQRKPINEYVRVTVYRYWAVTETDAEGNTKIKRDSEDRDVKDCSLDPSYIDLHFVEGDGWTIDTAASTPERTVLYYYKDISVGEETSAFVDKITINPAVATEVDSDGNYAYEDRMFCIKAVVDAVQTHNADQARTGAWGTYLEGGAGK